MNREEYLAEVVSFIKSKKAKIEIQKELNTHIDDRIEYYTNAGYDLEYATNKAISQMGSAEDVAKELGKVHNIKIYWGIAIFLIVSNVIAPLHFYPFIFVMEHNLGAYQTLREFSVFLAFVITTKIAISKKMPSLPIINIISVSVWSILPTVISYLASGNDSLFETASPLAYFLHCILTFRIKNYGVVLGTYACTRSSLLLNIESLILYAILFAVAIFISISIRKDMYKELRNKLKYVPVAYFIGSAVCVAVGFVLLIPESSSYAYDYVYIQGSNDKENIVAETKIDMDYDWSPYAVPWSHHGEENAFDLCYPEDDDDNETTLIRIDECISLEAYNSIYEAKSIAKYYRFVFYESDPVDFDVYSTYETEWKEAKEGSITQSVHDERCLPINTITIRFTNRELIKNDKCYRVYAQKNGDTYSDFEYVVFYEFDEIARGTSQDEEPIFTYVSENLLKKSIPANDDTEYYFLDSGSFSRVLDKETDESNRYIANIHFDDEDKAYISVRDKSTNRLVLDEPIDTGEITTKYGYYVALDDKTVIVIHPKGKSYNNVVDTYKIS